MKNTLFLLLINLISCNYSPNNNPIKELELIDKLKELDAPLKTPEAGEWLFENKEKGQTFETYKTQSPVRPNAQQTCIYIQPIGVFTEGGYKIIQYTAEYVELFFNLKTIVLNSINDTEIPAKSRRINNGIEQLHTKYILDTILNHSPNDALVTMAITAKDLYPEDAWNYVFGEAYTQKRKAVSSIFRYMDSTFTKENDAICLERLIKTSAHEIGHIFTCLHCTHAQCVMNGSNSLPESDAAPNSLCSECLKKLSWNLLFDNKKRLNQLKTFYNKHGLNRDYKTVSDAIIMVND